VTRLAAMTIHRFSNVFIIVTSNYIKPYLLPFDEELNKFYENGLTFID